MMKIYVGIGAQSLREELWLLLHIQFLALCFCSISQFIFLSIGGLHAGRHVVPVTQRGCVLDFSHGAGIGVSVKFVVIWVRVALTVVIINAW